MNVNEFVLFKNLKKEKETQPDYTGRMNFDGKQHWISAWEKTNDKMGVYFSGSIRDEIDVYDTLPKETIEKIKKQLREEMENE